ncbi:MAG: hypothetical protein FJZ62_05090 [Chlamydiae bacterium]|nr:hypothetical protein [Chlamydiota bacterium]
MQTLILILSFNSLQHNEQGKGIRLLDSKFEDRIHDLDLLQIHDLDSLIPFFQDALKFLHQFKIIQAKGDLVEKNRMQKVIAQLKELLLVSMDRIEERVKLSSDAIESYFEKYDNFSLKEQEFLDLLRLERKKTFHKTKTNVDPVAKIKKGKTKVKNWMRP